MPTDKLKINANLDPRPKAIFGISGSLDFYRLAYFLGKAFNKSLEKGVLDDANENFEISFYKTCIDGKNNVYFIENKQGEGLLLNKVKIADYLLIVTGDEINTIVKTVKLQLQAVGAVQSVFAIDDKFTSKTKLKYFD